MTHFQCIPIPTEIAERFRRSGVDDSGNALRRMPATSPGSFPCRHCLRCAQPGDAMLLGSYDLPRPLGIYWTPSPIFVHAGPCARFTLPDTMAPIVTANGLVSVRAYDDEGLCLYDLGHVCPGAKAEAPLRRALDDRRTAFASVHTARPGCLLTQVERLA